MYYLRIAAEKCKDPSTKLVLQNCVRLGTKVSFKEDKFINFLKNSQKIQDPGFCKLIWNAIYKEYDSDPNKIFIHFVDPKPSKLDKHKLLASNSDKNDKNIQSSQYNQENAQLKEELQKAKSTIVRAQIDFLSLFFFFRNLLLNKKIRKKTI